MVAYYRPSVPILVRFDVTYLCRLFHEAPRPEGGPMARDAALRFPGADGRGDREGSGEVRKLLQPSSPEAVSRTITPPSRHSPVDRTRRRNDANGLAAGNRTVIRPAATSYECLFARSFSDEYQESIDDLTLDILRLRRARPCRNSRLWLTNLFVAIQHAPASVAEVRDSNPRRPTLGFINQVHSGFCACHGERRRWDSASYLAK